MLAVLKQYPRSINLLLSSSLLLTLGRAVTLPYLIIYLSANFNLGVGDTGLVLGGAMIIAVLLSLYGGFLADRFCRYRLILCFTLCFITGFLGMCVTNTLWIFFAFLVAFNFAFSVVDVVVKAEFGRLLPVGEQSRVFSIRYTLINVGYAVGPFLGAGLAQLSIKLPFVLSACLGLVFLVAYWRYGERATAADKLKPIASSFLSIGRVLLKDRRLVCFTIGGVLSAVTFGQFSAYISQYLVTTSTPEYAYQVISTVVAVNGAVVICLQYTLGRHISFDRLNLWLSAGLGLFLIALIGFAMATSVLHWALAMVVFTVGEIIVFPTEYMFIDRIAPPDLRGMYYGAQNLSNLGSAMGPVLCGFALANYPPLWMFYMLAAFIIAGGFFYLFGASIRDK